MVTEIPRITLSMNIIIGTSLISFIMLCYAIVLRPSDVATRIMTCEHKDAGNFTIKGPENPHGLHKMIHVTPNTSVAGNLAFTLASPGPGDLWFTDPWELRRDTALNLISVEPSYPDLEGAAHQSFTTTNTAVFSIAADSHETLNIPVHGRYADPHDTHRCVNLTCDAFTFNGTALSPAPAPGTQPLLCVPEIVHGMMIINIITIISVVLAISCVIYEVVRPRSWVSVSSVVEGLPSGIMHWINEKRAKTA